MNTIVIDTIELQPYDHDRVIVVSGHNADEVIAWFKEHNSNPGSNNLKEIKQHFAWVNEMVEQIEDCREDLAGMDKDGGSSTNGMYAWEKLKSYPGSTFRMIILKYGFKPSNPAHMTTLSHEVLHLCQEFLPTFLDRNLEKEAEAYFHSYIVEKIYKLFL
jgi:hypothetical protein